MGIANNERKSMSEKTTGKLIDELENVSALDRKFKLGLILNTGFTLFEFIVGFLSGSLALTSDAAHNLTDSLSLLIAFVANRIASRKADVSRTYGYGRVTILAAWLNATMLLVLALYIFFEAYQRFRHPEPVEGGLVMVVAFVGIVINGSVALLFRQNRADLNTRSAFLSMAFDTLASIGALLAGLIIVTTGQTIVDPLISVGIGIMLIASAFGIVKDALHILLEGVPEGLDVNAVKQAILAVPGVKNLDDLHIWAISSEYAALTCHLIIENIGLEPSLQLVDNVEAMLKERFKIEHATIEIHLSEGPHHGERMDEGL